MSFDVAADAYDAFMGRWSRQLARPFAAFAGVEPGHRVLDVGAGTGALSEILGRLTAPARVAAVEPSPPFVAALRERLPAAVDVREGIAEALPYPDATFDAALAQLVVHFMADPVRGLAEMRRVTRPGGAVAACVWDYAGGRGPLGVFWEAAREIRPDAPGESQLAGTRDGQLVELLAAAGLRDPVQAELSARIEHPTFEAWWEPFTRGAGPAGAFVASLDPAERDRLRAACERRLPGRPVTVAAVAWAARGTA